MKISVSVKTKRLEYDFELNSKVTVIQGDSASGKTSLVDLIMGQRAQISVTGDYSLFVLNKMIFDNLCKKCLKNNDGSLSDEEYLSKMWTKENPFEDSVIFVDEEDFVETTRFARLVNSDISCYYVIIDRSNLAGISYSPDNIFILETDGRKHWLRPKYTFDDSNVEKIDAVLVEGTGSDYLFFKKLFENCPVWNPMSDSGIISAGRNNIPKYLKKSVNKIENKTLFLAVDYCAFGSNVERVFEECFKNNLRVILNSDYISFEYLLLKSNLIDDAEIDDIINENYIAYSNIEKLCTKRLVELTKYKYFKYSKSPKRFSDCYTIDCCSKHDKNDCGAYKRFRGKDKINEMLRGTIFEFLLRYAGRI